MSNNMNDNYALCVDLSRKGDFASLNQLMTIYLSSDDVQTKKEARKGLRKAFNRKAVIGIIHNALELAGSTEEKLDILQMAILIERHLFLYEYFMAYRSIRPKINKSLIEDMQKFAPFSDREQLEIVRYMIDSSDYSIILYRVLNDNAAEVLKKAIVDAVWEGNVSHQMLTIIGDDAQYLAIIQKPLSDYIRNNLESSSKYYKYLDPSLQDNGRILNNLDDLFAVYRAISKNEYDDRVNSDDSELVRIAKTVKNCHPLSDKEWLIIKETVDRALNEIDDVNRLDGNFYAFLRALVQVDREYAERIYLRIYEETGMYSGRTLNEMVEAHLLSAYRIMTQILITAKSTASQCRALAKLLKYYPDNASSTFEYVKDINNPEVTDKYNELVIKYGITDRKNEIDAILEQNQAFVLIDHNVIVSELISRIASKINATIFRAAVGFAYTSGFKMLRPAIDKIYANGGAVELVLGSLQSYGNAERNSRIDRSTARYLNDLLNDRDVRLFTYSNTFYHGKFYYIGNEQEAYVIIGSSNISKTAYLSNYELDSMFHVLRNGKEDIEFNHWYTKFRYDCDVIKHLDEDQFEEFDWKAEQQAYGSRNVKSMSMSEVTDKISALTDEETKNRLSLWLSYNPTEIYSNLGVHALDEYVVFLYDDNNLAVFESFVPGNAYYTFRYDDFDRLLVQLSGLSKTKMLLASNFLMRGYHIQDKERFEGKITKLFGGEVGI